MKKIDPQQAKIDAQAMADITTRIAALGTMTAKELRAEYQRVFGVPSRSSHSAYLRKRIAWQIQAQSEGGLSQRALDRIEELAPLAPVRWKAPAGYGKQVDRLFASVCTGGRDSAGKLRDPRLPLPGAIIRKEHGGKVHEVKVLDGGFEYEGQRYKSLSKVARAISNTNWNGFIFFGLDSRGNKAGATASRKAVAA